MRLFRLAILGLISCSSILTLCHAQTSAQSELQAGVFAYKNARFEEGITHFQHAVEMNPTIFLARLYLATSYAQQYIPGVETAENTRLAELALQQYKAALQLEPAASEEPATGQYKEGMRLVGDRAAAVKGIAYLLMQMKRFEEAKDYYWQALEIDLQDPEMYYSIAVIDWTESYQPRTKLRASLKLKLNAALIRSPECYENTGREPKSHSRGHRDARQSVATAARL